MRNYFYPKRFADYVTWSEGRELKKAGYVPQRDFSFGKQSEDSAGAEIKDIQTTLIDQPARATRRSQPIRVDLARMEVCLKYRIVTLRLLTELGAATRSFRYHRPYTTTSSQFLPCTNRPKRSNQVWESTAADNLHARYSWPL